MLAWLVSPRIAVGPTLGGVADAPVEKGAEAGFPLLSLKGAVNVDLPLLAPRAVHSLELRRKLHKPARQRRR